MLKMFLPVIFIGISLSSVLEMEEIAQAAAGLQLNTHFPSVIARMEN